MKRNFWFWIISFFVLSMASVRAEPKIHLHYQRFATNNIYGQAVIKLTFNIPANYNAELQILDFLDDGDEFWTFRDEHNNPVTFRAEAQDRNVSVIVAANYWPHIFFRVAAFPNKP